MTMLYTTQDALDLARREVSTATSQALQASAANILSVLTVSYFIDDHSRRVHPDFASEAVYNTMQEAGAGKAGCAQYAKNSIDGAKKLNKFWLQRLASVKDAPNATEAMRSLIALINGQGVYTNEHLTKWLKNKTSNVFVPEVVERHVAKSAAQKDREAADKAIEKAGKSEQAERDAMALQAAKVVADQLAVTAENDAKASREMLAVALNENEAMRAELDAGFDAVAILEGVYFDDETSDETITAVMEAAQRLVKRSVAALAERKVAAKAAAKLAA